MLLGGIMKIRYFFMLVLTAILFQACSENVTEPISPVSKGGSIQFHIDKATAPQNVVYVKAYLSRPDFDTLTAVLNITSDSSASISFEDVAVGTWRLKVNALSYDNKILYTGEDDVEIKDGEISEAYLQLTKVSSGVGGIKISVGWIEYKTLTLQPGPGGQNAFVSKQVPNGNFCERPYLLLFEGQHLTSQIDLYRAFFDFDLSSIPQGAQIVKAELHLYYDYHNDLDDFRNMHGEATTLVIKRVTQPWDKTTIMWSNQPQYSNADSLTLTTSGFGMENFHLDFTKLTQAYVDNPGSSYGFRISFENEKNGSLVILASCNNTDPAIRPKLVVTYK
jgi:hypothetical protein